MEIYKLLPTRMEIEKIHPVLKRLKIKLLKKIRRNTCEPYVPRCDASVQLLF